MISVIVPVYNVEPYLRKCLDSIVSQTYQDLEILVIDDGSTDGSGKICDEYAEIDERVKVFHTENRGLSCARNLGLDNVTGDWIGFVDSDDWVELDMYEALLKKAEESGADVVECGFYREHDNWTEERSKGNIEKNGVDALQALVRCELTDCVWNKLWGQECFVSIRFPAGRVYEDVATTYKAFNRVRKICSIDEIKYHYRQREHSLTKSRKIDNLVGRWLSHKERYDSLNGIVDESSKKYMLESCGEAIARTWSNYYFTQEDEKDVLKIIHEMNLFTKEQFPLLGYQGWCIRLRIGILFPHYLNPISFWMARNLNHLYKKIVSMRV